ncbi:MAG TPA: cytochrome P450, partial [Hyphomonas sp.]|nr:cytochrome P450 [Hyphomonas sp.]
SGTFDLMSEIAVPIPVLVIARILGVDEDRLPDFRQWSEDVILSLNPVRTPEETARMEQGS